MSITRCFDLIDLPCLKEINVVAGKNGLENELYWMHIAEAASDIDNLFDWLKPDDFLIITGNFLRDHRDSLYEIMKRAATHKLSGVLIYKSEYCEYPPQYAIDIADENDIPLFFLEDSSVSAIEIQYYMDNMILNGSSKIDPTKIIKDIYYGGVENSDLRVKRANFMGYNLDRCHCAITIKLYDKKTLDNYDFDKNLNDICANRFNEYTKGTSLYYGYNNRLFALLPRSKKSNIKIKKLCEIIRSDILRYNKDVYVLIGIGQGKTDMMEFRESILESIEITRVMRIQKDWNSIKSYCDMYAYILLYKMRSSDIAKQLYHRLFDKLNEYDHLHGSELKKVLKTYIKEGKNIASTAKEMYLHRNTLLYQLKKIEEITEMKLDDSDSDFQFIMGFYLENLIKYEETIIEN